MNITLNEYIHEFYKTKIDDKWKVVYEPFDNNCVTAVTGTIYVNESLIQTFSAMSNINANKQIVNLSTSRKKVKPIAGHLIDNNIVLYWNENPGDEHFLCVSYEFHEQIVEKAVSTWLQEGF